MVSDERCRERLNLHNVSIRFEVRGGFRLHLDALREAEAFQSALRFAVVSDVGVYRDRSHRGPMVSIRFEVRGGFRRATVPTSTPA